MTSSILTYILEFITYIFNYTHQNLPIHIKEIRKWFIANYYTLLKNRKKLKAPIIKNYIF